MGNERYKGSASKLRQGIAVIKKIMFLVFIMTSYSLLLAQDIFVGWNILIGVPKNKGLGLSINNEYKFEKTPISIRLSAKFFKGIFEDSPYLSGYYHELTTVETNFLYRFSDEIARPYVGLGIGYTFVSFDNEAMGLVADNCFVSSKDPGNAINYNVLAGITFISQDFFAFYVEFLYRIININFMSDLDCRFSEDATLGMFTLPKSVLVNTLFINIGFGFRL